MSLQTPKENTRQGGKKKKKNEEREKKGCLINIPVRYKCACYQVNNQCFQSSFGVILHRLLLVSSLELYQRAALPGPQEAMILAALSLFFFIVVFQELF